MKKSILSIASFTIVAAILLSYSASAPPAGQTGSPGDNANCTSCHSGTPSNDANMITTDIPSSGYAPSTLYNITVTVTDGNSSKFGFQLSPQDNSGNGLGTLSSGANTTITDSKYISHAANQTAGAGGSKSWSFQWSSPPQGTGTVTFYAAGNATDGMGNTTGDKVYLGTSVHDEDPNADPGNSTSVTSIKKQQKDITLFPNPVHSVLNFAGVSPKSMRVLNYSGQTVLESDVNENAVDVSSLPNGQYIFQVETNQGAVLTERFSKF